MKPGDKVVCVDNTGQRGSKLSLLRVYEITTIVKGYLVTAEHRDGVRYKLKDQDDEVFFPERFILLDSPAGLQTLSQENNEERR